MEGNAENGVGRRESGQSENRNVQIILSALAIALGLVLVIYKIYADSEPGLIPLLLVIFGIGSYLVTRIRMRST